MKNSVALIAGVALLAVGYVGGAYVGYPLVEKEMLEGNIDKAKVYNQATSAEVLAAMEQLANDTTLQQEVVFTTALLNGRIQQMDQLVNATAKATEGIEDLKGLNEEMVAQSKRTANANAAYETYLAEIGKVVSGEKSEAYEQTKNNAMMAFLNVENCLSYAPELINSILCYTEAAPSDELDDLIGQWAQYNAEDAVLNDSPEDIAYWESAYNTLNNTLQLRGRSLAMLRSFPSLETALGNLSKTSMLKAAGRYYSGPVNGREMLQLYSRSVRGRFALYSSEGSNSSQEPETQTKPRFYCGPVGVKETLQSRSLRSGLRGRTLMSRALRSAF